MAAQARHYEKGIVYSSRQVDDKYISSKSRHNSHLKSSSRESSPYRSSSKPSSHSSPGGRKRTYNSPNSTSKTSANSPYDSVRKKDRNDRLDNDMGKNECQNSIDPRTETKVDEDEMVLKRVQQCRRCPVNGYKDDNDWSEHLSSSGKIYYYNKRTEESQWEVPKGWHDRNRESKEPDKDRSSRSLNFNKESNNRDDFHEVRDPRDLKDYNKYKEKNISKDYRVQDSRSYRDPRKNREKDPRDRDRDYRDRESRDYDGKHRVTPGSSKREVKYSSPSIRTIGQSTPSSSSTSHSRSYRRPTPDSLNGSGSGSVQDISPPGTPTNDDIVVTLSTMSPAPLYTSHISSPLITTAISTTRVLPLPTTPHTPLLSPIVHNSSSHLSTSYLHPLQQALLLQQQQATTTTTTNNKDTFGSPKLPTVKNHISEVATTTPTSSPRTSSSSSSNQKSVPMVQSPDISSNRSDSTTPPPPPPPPKENNRVTDMKDRTPKPDRLNMQTPPTTQESRTEHNEHMNRSKTHEIQPEDTQHTHTPVKTTPKPFNSERLIKRTIKLEREEAILFPALPDLDIYSEYFSPSVAEFHTSFYCNALENQISSSWEETMSLLHTDGYRSKFNLSICKQSVDCQDSKLDISSGWVDALNAVIQKVESLQDSSMSSESRASTREIKLTKKNRTETNSESSSSDNCDKNHTNDAESNNKEKNSEIPNSKEKESVSETSKPSIMVKSEETDGVLMDQSSR